MSFVFGPKIRLNMLRSTFLQSSHKCKRSIPHCLKAPAIFMIAFSLENQNKLIEAPSPQKLTSEYLISQASVSTISATQQLLTLTLAAIFDTANVYRECMEKLMRLMDESLQVNGVDDAYAELWDQVVAMRIKVGDCKQRLQELSSFMEYVDKLATSAAETAYIGGAEHMSTIMCETLNSVHTKLEAEYDKTKAKEMELLKQQENFVRRACELENELKRRENAVKNCKL